jgi:glycerol uptake facilitator-like aquaporin
MIPYLAEYLGSVLFIGSIRATGGNPLWSAIGLAVSIYLTAGLSGGNLNPAVSIMNMALGVMTASQTAIYIVSQVLAGLTVAALVPRIL